MIEQEVLGHFKSEDSLNSTFIVRRVGGGDHNASLQLS